MAGPFTARMRTMAFRDSNFGESPLASKMIRELRSSYDLSANYRYGVEITIDSCHD
jgi:hypothetical protein